MNLSGSQRPRRHGGALITLLDGLWSARTWRATLHVLAGVLLSVVSFAVVVGLPIGAGVGTAWSVFPARDRSWALTAGLAVLTVASLAVLPWCVRGFSALQRRRFALVLRVEIPPPPRRSGGGWPRDVFREWWGTGMWRQVVYHLLGLLISAVGFTLTALCWSSVTVLQRVVVMGAHGEFWPDGRRPDVGDVASVLTLVMLLLAAPWVARGAARVDTVAAQELLGPSRSEALAQRVETLARSRSDLVEAADAERRRIERDLHDGAQQRLVSLAMKLGMARATHADAPEPTRQALAQAHDEAKQALTEMRDLVRGLHPAVLDDRGLDAALSGIVGRSPLPVRLRVDVDPRCSPTVEAVAYFIVSETLTNVIKHAGATRADVTVERVGDRLRITVTDDGRGGAREHGGSGLRGLTQRAASVDGTFAVDSPPGGPTTITAELPCES